MKEDVTLKKEYKDTFAEIHASEALTGKVMNMARLEKRKVGSSFARRFATVAAAIAVIFVGSNGIVYAATGSTWVSGIFKDITNWHGAVVGTEYVQATDEVAITVLGAVFDNGYVSLPVEIVFHNKDTAPFKYVEEVTLEKCEVLDEAGNLVSVNDESVTGIVKDGVVEIIIPISGQEMTANTEYTLVLESFYGQSKGDAPLEIKGTWECKFVISEKN